MNREILIKYKAVSENEEIRLFGNLFVENNKDKCKIIINEKEYELKSFHKFDNKIEDELEIKLVIFKDIIIMSY